jgi:hypothetical protein
MGLIGRVLGMGNAARQVGEAVGGVAEVFVGNRAERDAQDHAQFSAVLDQFGGEFAQAQEGRFGAFVNGLNRLPRPMLALGTLALFGYAMGDPAGFSVRMQGLALVPEPLWWLLGAIVSFYFGARELHYQRARKTMAVAPMPSAAQATLQAPALKTPEPATARAVSAIAAAPARQARSQLVAAPARKAAVEAVAAASAPVAVRASDPHFNAALEEWRRLRG